MKSKWRRRLKIALVILVGLVVVVLLGDFIYSTVIARRIAQWESTIERDADGVQTGFADYTIGDGDTALLMIHGINDSPRCWYKMAPLLKQRGFTCRVMRLPGFAETVDNYAAATREQWLTAVDGELKALREKHKRVCIVAHSLGGAVTIAHLLKHPDAADAVVLIAPAVQVSSARSPLFSTRFWHEFANWTLPFTTVTETPYDIDVHDESERDYEGRMVFAPRHLVDETFALIDNNRSRASELTTPLMMVLSKDDIVIDWQAAEKFYEQTASPRKTLIFTPDTGHAIPVDNGWHELTDQIAEFLNDLAEPRD